MAGRSTGVLVTTLVERCSTGVGVLPRPEPGYDGEPGPPGPPSVIHLPRQRSGERPVGARGVEPRVDRRPAEPLVGGPAEPLPDGPPAEPPPSELHLACPLEDWPTVGPPVDAEPTVPLPRTPGRSGWMRSQPVGAAISATVLGAAAVTSAGIPPLEPTGSTAPGTVRPAVAGPTPVAPVPAPAPAVTPDRPTVRGSDLVADATAQLRKVEPTKPDATPSAPYAMVAGRGALPSATAPAAMRRAAVSAALSKIGTPYRWGATGPNAFDCSGLVKWSFAKVGRQLPRTSRAQAGVGKPVSRKDLQPGDLVFFYKPISHVGIYIGDGKIVHASRRGEPVKISDMGRMKYVGARRV
jgi:cell wall-associated NlpC family hydrolase